MVSENLSQFGMLLRVMAFSGHVVGGLSFSEMRFKVVRENLCAFTAGAADTGISCSRNFKNMLQGERKARMQDCLIGTLALQTAAFSSLLSAVFKWITQLDLVWRFCNVWLLCGRDHSDLYAPAHYLSSRGHLLSKDLQNKTISPPSFRKWGFWIRYCVKFFPS